MEEHAALEAACKHGRLIISRSVARFEPFQRSRRVPGWAVSRTSISGAECRIRGIHYELTVHTRHGVHFTVEDVNPPDAFAAVSLLGYVWSSTAAQRRTRQLQGEASMPCKWGHLVISRERVALLPHPWSRRHGWSLPRNAISGVGYSRSGGTRLLRDLIIYTRAGTDFPVFDLVPRDALALVRALGLLPDGLPIGRAPVHVQPPATPAPGAEAEHGVVIVPAPAHALGNTRRLSLRLPRLQRSEGQTDRAQHEQPHEPHAPAPSRSEPNRQREQSGAGAVAHGYSTKAGMLAALALLSACTVAIVAGHGLPGSWALIDARPAQGGKAPVGAAEPTALQPTVTALPRRATHVPDATPTRKPAPPTAVLRPAQRPAAKPRPTPTRVPRPTATPQPTPTAMPTATATPAPTPTQSALPTPTATTGAKKTPTPVSTVTASPETSPSATP